MLLFTGSSTTVHTSRRALPIILVCIVMLNLSCSKDKDSSGDGDQPGRQVSDVVPAEYLKTLTDHGFEVNEGTTPPTVNGKFLLSKFRFDYDNYREAGVYPAAGTIMNDMIISFTNQAADQSIQPAFGGGAFTGVELENPFITGHDNKFTACFTIHIAGGSGALFVYPFVYLFSGTVDGDVIRNMRVARIGLEDDKRDEFTVAGEVDLYSDVDGTSPKVP